RFPCWRPSCRAIQAWSSSCSSTSSCCPRCTSSSQPRLAKRQRRRPRRRQSKISSETLPGNGSQRGAGEGDTHLPLRTFREEEIFLAATQRSHRGRTPPPHVQPRGLRSRL